VILAGKYSENAKNIINFRRIFIVWKTENRRIIDFGFYNTFIHNIKQRYYGF